MKLKILFLAAIFCCVNGSDKLVQVKLGDNDDLGFKIFHSTYFSVIRRIDNGAFHWKLPEEASEYDFTPLESLSRFDSEELFLSKLEELAQCVRRAVEAKRVKAAEESNLDS